VKDPRGSRYLKGSNSRKVEADPEDHSPQLENLLKERILWKEPDWTTVLTGETQTGFVPIGFQTSKRRRDSLCNR
jgi:hypothetical protein